MSTDTLDDPTLRRLIFGTLGFTLLSVVAVAFAFRSDIDEKREDLTERVAAGSDEAPSTGEGTDGDGAPAGPPDDGATGFYLPGDLPEGWTIDFTGGSTRGFPEPCPCETRLWRNDDGAELVARVNRSREKVTRPGRPPGSDTAEYSDIPGGYLGSEGDEVRAQWLDGEVTKGLYATGLEATVVEGLIEAWIGDEPPEPPAGFEHVFTGTMPAIESTANLYWTIQAPDGRSMVVHVTPWMFDQPLEIEEHYADVEPIVLAGNGLIVAQTPRWDEPHMEGFWPGWAHVTVAENYGEFNYTGPYLTAEEMREVAGGFRPATAEEWADYVRAQFPLVDDPATADDEEADAEATHDELIERRLFDLRETAD